MATHDQTARDRLLRWSTVGIAGLLTPKPPSGQRCTKGYMVAEVERDVEPTGFTTIPIGCRLKISISQVQLPAGATH